MALDDCHYDGRTAQPLEGTVVDSDEDLVALCNRMQESDNKHCAILFCDELCPRFTRDGGTILNVLSSAAFAAKPNESVYCAAKWGARGYTDVLKAEARGTRARVISVAPGGMQTPFWEHEREGFMDPGAVAKVIVAALDAPVNVTHIAIDR